MALSDLQVGDETEAASDDARSTLALALQGDDDPAVDAGGEPATGTALAVVDGSAPAVQDPAPVVEDDDPEVPWTYDFDNRPYQQPGAHFREKSRSLRFETPEAFQRFVTQTRHGRMYETRARHELRKAQNEVARVQRQAEADMAQANYFMQQWLRLIGPDLTDRDALHLLYEMRQNAPEIRAQAALAEARALKSLPDPSSQDSPAHAPVDDLDEVTFEAQQAVRHYVTTDPSFQALPWLTDSVRSKVLGAMLDPDTVGRYVVQVSAREAQQHPDRRVGSWQLRWDLAKREWDRLTEPFIDAHAVLEQERQRVAAEAAKLGSVAPVLQANNRTAAKADAQANAGQPNKSPAPPSVQQASGQRTGGSNRSQAFATLREKLAAADVDD